MKTINIMIVGVGGQGTLLASRIIGSAASCANFEVKVSEVHGMAQRGGSVVTYVRFGKSVYSPVIAKGDADIILAFEELEAYRWLSYLKKDGTLIVNTQNINPMPVILGFAEYPDNIVNKMKSTGASIIDVDALHIAENCGNVKAVNVVLIGLLASQMSLSKDAWEKALAENVPAKFLELNKKAFEEGYNLKDNIK